MSSPGSAGSPLDRIEAHAKTFPGNGAGAFMVADVLALVNVAKAAEKIPPEIMAMLPKLREALAVLDEKAGGE